MQKLTILGTAPRNAHGQACIRVQCSCGSPEFIVREDSYKQNRTTSCGCTRRKKDKPAPEPDFAQQIESNFERDTPEWYKERIAVKKAAALAAEERAHALEERLRTESFTNFDTHKQRKIEAATARDLWAEIARLQAALDKAETAVVKEQAPAESRLDKLRALKEMR
jgi:hypothetical protein